LQDVTVTMVKYN